MNPDLGDANPAASIRLAAGQTLQGAVLRHPAKRARCPGSRAGRSFRAAVLLGFIGLIPLSVDAGSAPQRKPGLWEITINAPRGDRPRTMQQCIDEKSDDFGDSQAPGLRGVQPQCEKRGMRRDGDSIVIDSVCRHDGTTIATRATVAGNLDSSYRMEARSTYDPPLRGTKESTTVVVAKWLGPCKPDQKPGDMIIPGMGKFNAQEMRERMQSMPKPQ